MRNTYIYRNIFKNVFQKHIVCSVLELQNISVLNFKFCSVTADRFIRSINETLYEF